VKKWIWIITIIVVVVVLGLSVNVYRNAVKPVNTAEEKAVSIAKKKTDLVDVEDFHLYHGEETIYVIEGKNTKGENIIIWIPKKDGKMMVKKASKGLSKRDAINSLPEGSNPKKILSVRLGMEKGFPLWEIYYLSENNLINYYLVFFESGEMLRNIENL
jgi:uncharacterized protein YpmB